ncbi:MAG: hypothetical protein Kow0037_15170 [Calditrichia bacterium]
MLLRSQRDPLKSIAEYPRFPPFDIYINKFIPDFITILSNIYLDFATILMNIYPDFVTITLGYNGSIVQKRSFKRT